MLATRIGKLYKKPAKTSKRSTPSLQKRRIHFYTLKSQPLTDFIFREIPERQSGFHKEIAYHIQHDEPLMVKTHYNLQRNAGIKPLRETFECLSGYWYMQSEPHELAKIIVEMHESQTHPTSYEMNLLLDIYAKELEVRKAEQVIENMLFVAKDARPNAFTVMTMLNMYRDLGKGVRALRFLESMKEHKVEVPALPDWIPETVKAEGFATVQEALAKAIEVNETERAFFVRMSKMEALLFETEKAFYGRKYVPATPQ